MRSRLTLLVLAALATVRDGLWRCSPGGYEVVHAASGDEALEICRAEAGPFDLLPSDVVMPGMNGRELAEAVRSIRPDIAVLLVSGHHEDEILERGIDERETAFLWKPFDAPRLVEAVHGLLAGR